MTLTPTYYIHRHNHTQDLGFQVVQENIKQIAEWSGVCEQIGEDEDYFETTRDLVYVTADTLGAGTYISNCTQVDLGEYLFKRPNGDLVLYSESAFYRDYLPHPIHGDGDLAPAKAPFASPQFNLITELMEWRQGLLDADHDADGGLSLHQAQVLTGVIAELNGSAH